MTEFGPLYQKVDASDALIFNQCSFNKWVSVVNQDFSIGHYIELPA